MDKIRELIDEKKLNYSFIYKDLRSGEEFSIRPHTVVSSASTIKLMIMAAVYRLVKDGRLDWDRTFVVTEADRVDDTLPCGATYRLDELIALMIGKSDNIATNLLIDAAGVSTINRFIQELGLPDTRLQRKMMDFDARKKGIDNTTSASDLARFLERLYSGNVIDREYSCAMLEVMRNHPERSWWRKGLPEDVIVAHKTGDLEGLKHDAGIVFTPKGDYLFALLTWDCRDEEYQKDTFIRVSRFVYDHFIRFGGD